MINIAIPLAGKSQYFPDNEYPFPKPLIEINGKTMIEYVLKNFQSIQKKKQFIFIVNDIDCKKYHLDNILYLLTNQECKIIKVNNETGGSACSVMLAVDYINNSTPLIIANADQIIDVNLETVVDKLSNYDAGVITFESVHPRWSYVRVNDENLIVETAEKRPISKNAIAGFYYFSKGEYFMSSSEKMIRKDACVNAAYYISPTLNELILENMRLSYYRIENNCYHTFYTPKKIKEFERNTCAKRFCP